MLSDANRDNAIIDAAKMAFDHSRRCVLDERATSHSISVALVPLFGISWSRKIIAAVDTRPINRRSNQLLARVRNSPLPRADCGRVADLFKLSLFAPTEFSPEW